VSNLAYTEITTVAEWQEAWTNTAEKPLLLFKHSTTCPISADALQQFNRFVQSAEHTPETAAVQYALVKVIESREVSNQVAEDVSVKHESPQAILIHDQKAVWDASHWSIKDKALQEAVEKLQS
jgi:bacillithiol system protein YtxJ